MAYRKARKTTKGKSRNYRKTAPKSSKSRSAASKKRASIKSGNRAGTVKFVLEHAAGSEVARPDGLAGAFQMNAREGRARL